MTRRLEAEIAGWGVFDAVDQCWLGTNAEGTGPRVFEDEAVAMHARDFWAARFASSADRFVLRRFMPEDAASVRPKDEVEPPVSFEDALRVLGWNENEVSA